MVQILDSVPTFVRSEECLSVRLLVPKGTDLDALLAAVAALYAVPTPAPSDPVPADPAG